MSTSTLAAETIARIDPISIATFRERMAGGLLTPHDNGYDEECDD